MRAPTLDEDEESIIYNWVDEQQLSRPKRNIHRDFADGVLVAEIINNYFPKYVELHNYSAVSSKTDKINYQVSADDIYDIIASKPGVIEAVLRQIQLKIAQHTLVTDPKKDSVLGSVSDSSSIKGKRFSVGAEKYAAPSKTIGKDKSAKEMSDSYIYKIQEQEDTISELKQTIMLMETKMKKYEEMISIKDDQIREMKIAMEQAGLL